MAREACAEARADRLGVSCTPHRAPALSFLRSLECYFKVFCVSTFSCHGAGILYFVGPLDYSM